MKVILTEDVPSLGVIGSVLSVKNGFARNFLIPRSMAVLADEAHTKEFEHRKRILAKKRDRILGEQKQLASKLEKLSIRLFKQTGEGDRIFGSVTTQDLSEALHAQGFEVSKKMIRLPEEVKKTGTYHAEIRLHTEVTARLPFVVAQQTAE